MGLNSSKAHGRVTKVAPLEEPQQTPDSGATHGFQSPLQGWSASSFASVTERTPVLERHLPPLRETWLGRYPAVPRPVPLDRLEAGETSIIKEHPPRRFQKLEPLVLATDIPSDKSWSRQRKARGLEKRGQDMIHPLESRQHLYKMKMLEMRQEAELKRCLQQEPRLNNPRRDLTAQQMLGRLQRDNSSDDEDLLAIEHDQTFNGDYGELATALFLVFWFHYRNKTRGHFKQNYKPALESHPGQSSKVERWLLKQQARRESFWDASSTDSETWDGDSGKPFRRPALVRTKAERIPLFDEFFDKDF
ncbi:factor associated with metabolism and energy [Tiliqua scincoides]|uniref:factor associated with metabolism and energy n=1 Tax=Tiliqua scincoides TaxID=71010 RepID=UPI0034631837